MESTKITDWLSLVVAIIFGISTLSFMWTQNKIAAQKRKDDLFQRRFDIFKNFLSVWGDIMNDQSKTNEGINKIHHLRYEAQFIFPKEINLFLIEMVKKFAQLQALRTSGRMDEEHQIQLELLSNHQDIIDTFKPHLKLEDL